MHGDFWFMVAPVFALGFQDEVDIAGPTRSQNAVRMALVSALSEFPLLLGPVGGPASSNSLVQEADGGQETDQRGVLQVLVNFDALLQHLLDEMLLVVHDCKEPEASHAPGPWCRFPLDPAKISLEFLRTCQSDFRMVEMKSQIHVNGHLGPCPEFRGEDPVQQKKFHAHF